MKNKDPDLDVQPEDWERQSSESRDLGIENQVNKALVDERIKTIQAQLIQNDERMARIENDLKSFSTGLIKAIQEQLKPYETKLNRIDDSWKSSVKWWVMFTLGAICATAAIVSLIK